MTLRRHCPIIDIVRSIAYREHLQAAKHAPTVLEVALVYRRVAILAVFAGLVAAQVSAQVVVNCPFNPGSGDNSSRGFYVTNYPASTLGTVTLDMTPFGAGAASDTLTARLGTYNGTVIGTATVNFTVGSSPQHLTYNFGNAAVAPGSTITFTHSITGPGVPDWDTGTGPCANVVETSGTTPPLDSSFGNSYGLQITATVPIPSLSEFHLLLLMASLAFFGAFALHRR